MANKNFEITITLTMEIGARNEEMAQERGERMGEAATKGIYDSTYRWKPEDIEAPDISVEELE